MLPWKKGTKQCLTVMMRRLFSRSCGLLVVGLFIVTYSLWFESTSMARISQRLLTPNGCDACLHSTRDVLQDFKASSNVLGELNELTGGDAPIDCPAPLIYYPNRVIQGNMTSKGSALNSERLIPKILHVSMKSRCLPDLLVEFLKRWERALPSYSIFFHDDEAVNNLLYQDWPEFPHLHETLQCVVKGAMKIDLWRQLVVFKYGGIYTDIDIYPTGLIDDTIEPNVSAWSLSDLSNRPSQWLFAMEPHHPIAQLTILDALDMVYRQGEISKPKPVFTTGPQVMVNAYKRFGHYQNDLLNDGYHVGMHGKVARKIKYDERFVAAATFHEYREVYPHPFDPAKNVTGRQRVEILTGVEHWTRTKHKRQNSVEHNASIPFGGSCQDYIKKLQNDRSIPLGFVA